MRIFLALLCLAAVAGSRRITTTTTTISRRCAVTTTTSSGRRPRTIIVANDLILVRVNALIRHVSSRCRCQCPRGAVLCSVTCRLLLLFERGQHACLNVFEWRQKTLAVLCCMTVIDLEHLVHCVAAARKSRVLEQGVATRGQFFVPLIWRPSVCSTARRSTP